MPAGPKRHGTPAGPNRQLSLSSATDHNADLAECSVGLSLRTTAFYNSPSVILAGVSRNNAEIRVLARARWRRRCGVCHECASGHALSDRIFSVAPVHPRPLRSPDQRAAAPDQEEFATRF